MSVTLGEGAFRYEVVEAWEQLPGGMTLKETPGVAVNSRDEVFLLTRNTDYPVMVFDLGGRFLRSFGKGVFDARTHGLFIGNDDAVWCVDDGTHSITKWTPEGDLQLTASRYVERHPLLIRKPGHCGAQEGLGRIRNAVRKGGDCFAAPMSQMSFVVDEQRRPELIREVDQVTAPNGQPAGAVDCCRVREQCRRQRRHIRSGTSMASRSSRVRSTSSVASTSCSHDACLAASLSLKMWQAS